ncbi:hypothetical protein CDA63_10335 [Hymenobacter amundsenii]|uniref:Outer membrane protein beta-barrel domain-containing protein n=1 Tax=Hymenobacter amundsenii TaxID=2006685 RepID=A0A2D0AFU9_9BACT|nr:hypothetical protein [Hymenobacter amundsenii]OWP63243.1 hypothetical protein CDA63_10335 [Hymenobacter amundsenii]
MKCYLIGGAAALLFIASAGQAQQLPREPEAQYPERPRGQDRFDNARTSQPNADPFPHYRSSLGLEMGWGAPYGLGVIYAYNVSPAFDVNVGAGIGVGAKIGVGARYYFRPDHAFTPYVGVNLVRTGRLENVNVDLNGEEAIYSMSPSAVAHLRGGIRWQPGRIGLLGTVGYGSRLTGDPVTYDPAYYPSPSLRDLVQTISPGGVEFSVGMVIGLGR